jgi:environmental stress-induced protein Ves
MKRFISILSAGTVALMLSNSAMAGQEAAVTADQVQAAATAADHEAIAVAYDVAAAKFDAMAKQHMSIAKAYRATAAMQKGIRGKGTIKHCEKLVETYKQAAKSNRQMATEHRAMKM